MTADFKVCLDACVLANQSVCDLLLRLADKWQREVRAHFPEDLVEELRISRLRLPRKTGYFSLVKTGEPNDANT
ncbi:MAG: hypothetical protein JJU29_03425 [Verrucomicrobia bacterium]|nr:hypothetical protein [Verrucomicrobiota bacterium]MCH8512547.1 hypothetical protein [Kiritimatiellia bacterium]